MLVNVTEKRMVMGRERTRYEEERGTRLVTIAEKGDEKVFTAIICIATPAASPCEGTGASPMFVHSGSGLTTASSRPLHVIVMF